MYDIAALDRYLTQLFQKKGYPSVTVALRGPDGILFEKGYGYTDFDRTHPADPDTIYGIASMSKSMTTLACAILQAEGKLDFSDPVTKYFPQFRIPGTPAQAVTLRHLAMHTSGIPPIPPLEWSIAMNTQERDSEELRQLRASAPNQMDTIEDIIAYIGESGAYEPLGAPGEYMCYSNDAYAILSYVVDQAAGQSLEDFLQERVFGPLGMTRTVLDLDGSQAEAMSGGNIAELFGTDEDGQLYADKTWSVLPPYRGCACVKSTARDMTRYYLCLAQEGRFEGKQVIPAEAVEILIGKEFPETNRPFYCFGLNKRSRAGRTICEHSGGLHGVSTHGAFIRETPEACGWSMVSLCNQGEVSAEPFDWAMLNLILEQPLEEKHYWAIPSGNSFQNPEMLVGTYLSREANPAYCIVTADEDGLHAEYYNNPLELHYCQGTVFSARSKKTPDEQSTTMEFLIRKGEAWGVRCYTRIFQRIEKN